MADKFPEIDIGEDNNIGADIGTGGDFLQREKDVLGDSFETDFPPVEQVDQMEAKDDDDEFDDFSEPQTSQLADEAPSQQDTPVEIHIVNKFENLNLDESEHIQKWKTNRDSELEKKEEAFERTKKETLAAAEKALDDFYETYNSKKEATHAEAKAAEKKFLEERDADKTNSSVWDSAIALLGLDKNSNSIDDELLRDKTRFKDMLLALKGKTNVPGSV